MSLEDQNELCGLIRTGDPARITTLLNKGNCDPNKRELKNYGLMSPFIAACKNAQHADIIQAFLDYKRTDVTGEKWNSPLLAAIEYRNDVAIDTLLKDDRIDPSETDFLRAFQAKDMKLIKKLASKAPIPVFDEGYVDQDFLDKVREEVGVSRQKSARSAV